MRTLHAELLARHGPQGWWPLLDGSGDCAYRIGDYTPVHGSGRAEIAIGAILTQNTNWGNVVLALRNLKGAGLLSWDRIVATPEDELAALIRPSGYFRQKARKLKEAAAFFSSQTKTPKREELLDLWGIGPETADSILCYAYGEDVLVVDAYLRRVLGARGYAQSELPYDALQRWVSEQLPAGHAIRNEFHALIVTEAKTLKA